MAQLLPFRPQDGYYTKDDFYSNEGVADTTVGELGWELVNIANAPTVAYLVTTDTTAGRPGVLRVTTAATADGDGWVLRLDEDAIVLDGQGGEFTFGFRYGVELASMNFRVGLQDSVTATDPGTGIVLTSDAGVLSIEAFSNDHTDETAAITGISTLTSGTTAVVASWHDVTVKWHGTNAQGGPANVDCYIDGELGGSIPCNIDNDEELELSIVGWQDSGGADAVTFDIDYIDLLINAKR